MINFEYNHFKRGFTLIEMIVVISIVTIISTVLLANYGKFGNKITLQNLTYDLALTIRQAQVYGLSGKFQHSSFSNSYPIIIYFDRSSSAPNLFYMFKDLNLDGEQSPGENIESYNFNDGYTIYDIQAGGNSGIEKLSIQFKRPEPDAVIRDISNGETSNSVKIIVQSPKGDKLAVFVESAGQISVRKVTTP